MNRPSSGRSILAAITCGAVLLPGARGEDAAAKPGLRVPEALEMFALIVARGADMGPGDGWFHPGQSRHGWEWLTARLDSDHDGRITPAEWGETEKPFFARLDRDHSDAITADDLDWSVNSDYLRRRGPTRRLSSMVDADSNGRITLEEWTAFYRKLAGEKGFMTPDDVAGWAAPPSPSTGGPPPGEMPSRWTLLKGFLRGEIGSLSEGPALDAEAPDFTLRTQDRDRRVSLGQFRGKKPVVLIFGSFT